MSKTNCVSCGAAKEVSDLQCPFCGTKYADLTMINFMSDEPIFIQLQGEGKVITARAYITSREMSFEPISSCIRGKDGRMNFVNEGMFISGKLGFALYNVLKPE